MQLLGRDTIWTDHFGTKRKVRDLDDTHVANIINWLPTINAAEETIAELLQLFKDEALERGLSERFLDRAQIPYKSPDGRWYVNMEPA